MLKKPELELIKSSVMIGEYGFVLDLNEQVVRLINKQKTSIQDLLELGGDCTGIINQDVVRRLLDQDDYHSMQSIYNMATVRARSKRKKDINKYLSDRAQKYIDLSIPQDALLRSKTLKKDYKGPDSHLQDEEKWKNHLKVRILQSIRFSQKEGGGIGLC
jgi:hypothetical protein